MGDNKAMIDLLHQEGASVQTRYYERATLFIKCAVQLLIFKPVLIKTTEMIADIFTKATDKGTFVKMRNVLMNTNSGLRNKLEQSMRALHGSSRKLAHHLLDRIF